MVSPTSEAATKERKSKGVLGCLFGFFFLFGLGCTAIFAWPVVEILEARNWRETPCSILKSEVEQHSGSKGGSTYSIEVTYEYFVADDRHVSSRYKFVSGSSSGAEAKQAVVDRLPPGTRTVCYVDPRNPAEAVIERGFTADLLFGFIPMIFAVIGLGGLFGTFVYRGTAKTQHATMAPRPGAPAVRGPSALKSSGSPSARLGCSLVFALIWNGIVSVFLVDVVLGWSRGDGDGCATVFLIPFLLVGLGLCVLVGYTFLGLFNPRPLLRVSSGETAALGDTVEVEWETTGNVERVKSFTITLEGREEATYRRGTSTSTDKSTFLTIELMKSSDGKDLKRGQALVVLPVDSMHTFKSKNNKILWSFHVKGEIPRWPDVGEEFPFEVLPKKGAP